MLWPVCTIPTDSTQFKDHVTEVPGPKPSGTRVEWEQKRDEHYRDATINTVGAAKDRTPTDTAITSTAVAHDLIKAQGANQKAHRFPESESGQSNKNKN